MDKMGFEIEIQDNQSEPVMSIQLPVNFITIGEIGNEDVKVYIKQEVYKELEKFASSETAKEIGSIILGDYCQDMGKTHVVISDFIEAKYTDATASTLTFTHETWDYIHKEHQRLYPDKKIIGWQHTHPNYGIFLSNYDMFIQENFFNMPFQVAYVIDPVQNQRGFFQWKNGRVEKLEGFYIYDDVGKPVKIEQTKIKEHPEEAQAKPSRLLYTAVGVLGSLTIALAVAVIFLAGRYLHQSEQQNAILNEINNQNAVIEAQEGRLMNIQNQLENMEKDAGGEITEDSEKEARADKAEASENSEELEKEIKEEERDGDVIQFKEYTVVRGDTLVEICEANNIDFAANRKIILAVNGIEDSDRIYAGQKLLLPVNRKN